MFLLILLFGVAASVVAADADPGPPYTCGYCQPEQIHIAFGEKTNDIVVTWSTFNKTGESRVQYGVENMDQEAAGGATQFEEASRQWIHRVVLRGLQHDTRYVYHCGSQFGWSELFYFSTVPAGEDWVVRAAIYGDMGVDNAHSLPYLQDEAERGHFDLALHVGDFAYDMHEQGSRRGDQFLRQLQPLAAALPYMTCPGNHEEHGNFSNYKRRFSMPQMDAYESMFYSWDLGPIHFVAVNTEAYYFLHYGWKPLFNQFEWLQNDLAVANLPENRAKRPWIVVYGHRPMYCTNAWERCWNGFLPNRVGLPFLGLGLEPLLKEYGVDVVIWAHEHSYERTWPLYDHQVYNGTGVQGGYHNPRAPVHIVTGSAGCRERTDNFVKNPPVWSAFRSSDYGYTRMKAQNKTHLYFEQVSVDLKGKVIDSFWVIQERHAPFTDI